MAEAFQEATVASTWIRACKYLMTVGGSASNVTLVIRPEATEYPGLRDLVDQRMQLVFPRFTSWTQQVANTIFPKSLYQPREGDEPGAARRHLYDMIGKQRQFLARDSKWRPTYIDRFVTWPVQRLTRKQVRSNQAPSLNQLEDNVVIPLCKEYGRRKDANHMELSVLPLPEVGNVALHDPVRDRSWSGTPCLSHISFSLLQNRLSLSALYRNHYYISKAYGNMIGLCDLLTFVSNETGFEMGEVLCLSTHADLYESGRFSQRFVRDLVEECDRKIQASTEQQVGGAA